MSRTCGPCLRPSTTALKDVLLERVSALDDKLVAELRIFCPTRPLTPPSHDLQAMP
jgi:hypothetical protein